MQVAKSYSNGTYMSETDYLNKILLREVIERAQLFNLTPENPNKDIWRNC